MFSYSRRNVTARKRLAALPLKVIGLTTFAASLQAGVLTLPEAEQRALAADYGVQALKAKSSAFAEQAIAADTWMDPTLSIGTMNLPGNKPDPFDQGMIELKVEQMLPRGDSAQIQRRKSELQGETARVAASDRQLTILREVRLAWLDAWYWQQALQQLQDDRHLFESLQSVTESMYSQGRKNQQDLLRAELELSRLEDRIVSFSSELAQSRAQLARWLGQADVGNISTELPDTPSIAEINDQKLLQHPLVQNADLAITQSEQDIALAKEGYNPQWGFEFKYGREMADMSAMGTSDSRNKFSAMVMLDIPLFTANRQERQLAASQYRREASAAQRMETLRQLQGQLQTEAARYQGLKNRLSLFRAQLVPKVISQSEASLKAYQADAGDFTDVIQSYKARLEMTLEYTRLQADTLQSHARLRYLLPAKGVKR
ncbi:TolC family protein [uncultured Endozoicomonas sp.]|uniref:TolC family protein n=1 Tax=uncultured Endozoicomonas sp. TaxID=432652 RepID=UPI00261F9129|nr:TolC family protein [uncultured Endozoicomonas sp.]